MGGKRARRRPGAGSSHCCSGDSLVQRRWIYSVQQDSTLSSLRDVEFITLALWQSQPSLILRATLHGIRQREARSLTTMWVVVSAPAARLRAVVIVGYAARHTPWTGRCPQLELCAWTAIISAKARQNDVCT